MKKPTDGPMRTIYFKVEEAQYRSLKDKLIQTTCRSLAEYIRKLVLSEPVTVNYRNASMEDLITELSLLRRQLADASRVLELTTQTLSASPSQPQLSVWLKDHQSQRAYLAGLIEQIYQHATKMAHLWLQ